MNIQKFTQKSIEAVNDCEKLAYDYGNQEIEQEHLLLALLEQEDGLIPKLIEKMEIDLHHLPRMPAVILRREPRSAEPVSYMWAKI